MTLLLALIIAAPAKLGFASQPGQVGTGACSAKVTVETEDAGGAPTPAAAPVSLLLSGPAAFFSTADCTGDIIDPAGALTVPGGSTEASFYFVHPYLGTVSLGVQSAQYSLVSQSWTVVAAPGVVSKLAFSKPDLGLTQDHCSPVLDYSLRDVNSAAATAQRKLVVSFQAAGLVQFFDDASCANRVLSVALPVGAQGGQVYVKGLTAGGFQMQATSPGLDSGSLSLLVSSESHGCASAGAPWAVLGILPLIRRRR